MKNKNYIAYNKRSCVTGKQLFDFFKENDKSVSWRRRMNNTAIEGAPVVFRWGNSYTPTDADIVFNANCNNATDKLLMMVTLYQKQKTEEFEKLRILPTLFLDPMPEDQDDINPDDFAVDGMVYVRDRNDHVRYCSLSEVRTTDKYMTKPILSNKREFRVHVVDNRVLGVYEKIPENDQVRIFKDENSRFRRLDMSNEELRRSIVGVRQQAKLATAALEMDYAGVDVIKSDDGVFVVEVNSSPSLNEPNIERWGNALIELKNRVLNEETTERD